MNHFMRLVFWKKHSEKSCSKNLFIEEEQWFPKPCGLSIPYMLKLWTQRAVVSMGYIFQYLLINLIILDEELLKYFNN